jgi:hypothetical protein
MLLFQFFFTFFFKLLCLKSHNLKLLNLGVAVRWNINSREWLCDGILAAVSGCAMEYQEQGVAVRWNIKSNVRQNVET